MGTLVHANYSSSVLTAKLLCCAQAKKGDAIDSYPECFQYAKKVHEGLKSVHVVASTSMSHTHSMEAVVALFRAAMNYRHDVLSAPQKQELEGWVRNSRVLKVIIEEKEREKAAKQGGSAAPEGQPSGQQQQQPELTTSAGAQDQSKDQEQGAVQQVGWLLVRCRSTYGLCSIIIAWHGT
jgi:hypothetical protein